jgi:hypothetical protein
MEASQFDREVTEAKQRGWRSSGIYFRTARYAPRRTLFWGNEIKPAPWTPTPGRASGVRFLWTPLRAKPDHHEDSAKSDGPEARVACEIILVLVYSRQTSSRVTFDTTRTRLNTISSAAKPFTRRPYNSSHAAAVAKEGGQVRTQGGVRPLCRCSTSLTPPPLPASKGF